MIWCSGLFAMSTAEGLDNQVGSGAVGWDRDMMLGERCLRKCVNRLMYSPGARVFRRRVLVGGLFLLTLLVIMARQEAESSDMRGLEANTLVLQAGFPARTINKTTVSSFATISATPSKPSHQDPLLPKAHHHPHLLPTSPPGSAPSSSSSSEARLHLPLPLQVQPDLKMASLVADQKARWFRSAHMYQPHLSPGEATPSCQKLIQNDPEEQERGKAFMEAHQRVEKTAAEYILETTRNCSRFVEERGYIMSATAEEVEFPLAYSIMMYTGLEQVERLLRAIYRPHNLHCIHVDLKSPVELMEAMRGIAGCLPNVFIASKLNKVYWSEWSSLEALIFCMEDLWKASKKWKYYINLTGQEFPLKTNLQLVRILRALNGSNIVDASTDPSRTRRWYNNFSPPHGIVPYKGMVFIMACRGFVDYLLHHPVAQDFLRWVRYTHMPDETYFPSLNHNPHLKVPGSYKGPPDTNAITKPYLARYVNWNTHWKDGEGRYNFRFPCYGMRVRNICIFGIRDLPLVTNRKELFVNKLYSTFEPLTFNCMEEWLLNMTIAEYAGHILFNTSFYSSLDIVRNKVV